MFKLPELVIFDLDNTLYDYEVANLAGEIELIDFLHANLQIPPKQITKLLGEARKIVKETLGATSSSHSRLMYVREFLKSNGFLVRATFALECEQVFWRAFLNKMVLFEGVEELLTYLRLSKSKLVLVTDLSTQIQVRKLAWLGLENKFDLIVTSEEAGGDKETGMPEKMLRRYLAPPAGRTWAIGDKGWDHLFPQESLFFKKSSSGKLARSASSQIDFSDFKELLSEIDFQE